MTSDAKLLPCPFCGGEAKVYGPVGWYRQYGISHSCRVFYGGSGDFTLGAKTEEEAIAQWNRRSDLCASGQQVRVKSLEWESSETSYTQANCVLGQYQITFLGEFECWQLSAPPKRGTYWKDGFSRHASKSAAKAAAQADYERRILAALTPAPQPEGHDEVQCDTCAGNGEIVTDWDGYLRPPEGAPADHAVADCPDCDGSGWVPAPDAASKPVCKTCAGFGWLDHAMQQCPDCKPDAAQTEAVPVAWALFDFEGAVCSLATKLAGPETANWTPLYAHPPQPSETVAEKALLQRAVDLIKGDLTGVEWKRACNVFVEDALRALKGAE